MSGLDVSIAVLVAAAGSLVLYSLTHDANGRPIRRARTAGARQAGAGRSARPVRQLQDVRVTSSPRPAGPTRSAKSRTQDGG